MSGCVLLEGVLEEFVGAQLLVRGGLGRPLTRFWLRWRRLLLLLLLLPPPLDVVSGLLPPLELPVLQESMSSATMTWK